MKVAALQMCSSASLADNLRIASDLIQQAAADGAELIVLPEYWCFMGLREADKIRLSEEFGHGPIQDFLATLAQRQRVYLVAGTIPITAESGKVFNSTLVFDSDGACVCRYDKIHLFSFDNGSESYDESATICRGDQVMTYTLGNGWKMGLAICYDLRFSELFRSAKEPDFWVIPAAFTTTTGIAHWEVLLRARAIENQAYVIASAQSGRHENGRTTFGHSMVIDPWGVVLAQQDEGPGVVSSILKRERIMQVRQQLPALRHRVL